MRPSLISTVHIIIAGPREFTVQSRSRHRLGKKRTIRLGGSIADQRESETENLFYISCVSRGRIS